MLHVNPAGYLLSAVSAEDTGAAMDCRACANYGYLYYQASGQSAIFNVEASHDGDSWMTVATYTATATQEGTAQYAAYYPYVRGNVAELYSGAGKTGVIWAYYAPGLK